MVCTNTTGFPQELFLRQIFFNIHLNDLSYFLRCDVCNFTDDTTSYACGNKSDFVLNNLDEYSIIAVKRFNSLFIITLLRRYVQNYITCTITFYKLFSDLFTRNNNSYNFRSKFDFVIPQVRILLKGSKSIRYYGPIIWSLVPEEIQYTHSLVRLEDWKVET